MTRRTKLLIGACFLVLAAVACWLLFGERKPAREQIRENIVALVQAVEAKDVTGCMKLISPEYRDSQDHTRVVLRKLAADGFREASSIDVTTYERSISISGAEATAVVEAEVTAVTSTGRNSWKLELTFTFKRERRQWRIVRAEGWQQIESGF